MKISQNDLLALEEKRKLPVVQSDFPEIAWVPDRSNDVLWLINRQTGAQVEIAAENVYKFMDEGMSVAEIFLGIQPVRKGA